MFRRAQVLAATVSSVTVGMLAPMVNAHADASLTTITQDQFQQALTASSAASKAREAAGWSNTIDAGSLHVSAAYDPSGAARLTSGAASSPGTLAIDVIVKGSNAWTVLGTGQSVHAALTLLRQPDAHYASTTASTSGLDPQQFAPSATVGSSDASAGDVYTSITEQINPAGDTEYHVVGHDAQNLSVDVTVTTAAGDGAFLTLAGTGQTSPGKTMTLLDTASYGPQAIPTPADTETVTQAAFTQALSAVVRDRVKTQAVATAASINASATKRHVPVTTARIRTVMRARRARWGYNDTLTTISNTRTGAQVTVVIVNISAFSAYSCSIVAVKGHAHVANCSAHGALPVALTPPPGG